MALFGRESHADRCRAERVKTLARTHSPFALASCLFGVVSVLDACTLLIGVAAGLAAIALGLWGLRDRRHRHLIGSRRLCCAGIGLGTAGLLASIVMGTVVYPRLGRPEPASDRLVPREHEPMSGPARQLFIATQATHTAADH